jgi:hypothetical protein
MKTYLTFLLLIAAIGVNAQTMIKVKSKSALADSIWMPKYGQEAVFITVTPLGDTVRSVDYYMTITSDTTLVAPLQIRYYDKTGAVLSTVQKQMPAGTFLKWTLLETKIYTWIFNNTKRLAKQN